MNVKTHEFTEKELDIFTRGSQEQSSIYAISARENQYIYDSVYKGEKPIGLIKSWKTYQRAMTVYFLENFVTWCLGGKILKKDL